MDAGTVKPLIVLNVLSLLLHSLGAFLLISLCKKGKKTVQQILLINLCVCEFVISVSILVNQIIVLLDVPPDVMAKLREASNFIEITMKVLFCLYYTGMIYITTDRLFGVMLNIRYPVFYFWQELNQDSEKVKEEMKSLPQDHESVCCCFQGITDLLCFPLQ